MLSTNFSLEEATVSEVAARFDLTNVPDSDTLSVMYKAATKLEKVRALLGNKPIHINSWYRSPVLNIAIGGSKTSQHPYGEAIDFICPEFGSPLDVCRLIITNKDLINYDQLILEHGWIHISFAIRSGSPRNQVLSLLKGGHYAVGLTDIKGNNLE